MKNIKFLFCFLAAVTVFTSCQKVIDLDLNSSATKFVIEGEVFNSGQPCRVRVTKTKNFSEDNNFEGITNAFVTISDNAGNADTLDHINNGMYESVSLTGVPGRTYYMTVKIDDETFTSVSQMPLQVNMDTLFSYDFEGFGDTIKLLNAVYFDPAGVKNNYRFVLTLNNDVKENIFINNDEFNDGMPALQTLFYVSRDEQLEAGDSVRVEMQCIDKEVYHYFFTLDQTISQSAAAPTNPISNITGGALGYFSAYTTQSRSIVVQ